MLSDRRRKLSFIRAGLSELGDRNPRHRRLLRRALRNEGALELLYEQFQDDIDNAVDGVEDLTMPSLPGQPAIGDGTLADKFDNFFKWLIENQDSVFAFLANIFKLFGGGLI